MSGFVSFIDPALRLSPGDMDDIAGRCASTLDHRGQDDDGVWVDGAAGVAIGHRRLFVIDLSPEEHQPLTTACGRYTIAYNGGVYNFRDLRRELELAGEHFCGHSDTEVLLAAIAKWGIEASVRRANGMFAFSLWDREDRVLYLAPDRIGQNRSTTVCRTAFFFGLEMKSQKLNPDFKGEVDRGAMVLLLRDGYIPAPYSIYRGISKLMPGTILAVPYSSIEGGQMSRPFPYWSAEEAARSAMSDPFRGSDEGAADELERLHQRCRGQVSGR
jgi:asparagine synthase (glutamine-hydrolysing)